MISESLIGAAFLLVNLNAVVFFVFRSFMFGRENAAFKFLFLNIVKDVIWLVFALLMVEKTRFSMLVLMLFFLLCSFVLYFAVIRLINKS